MALENVFKCITLASRSTQFVWNIRLINFRAMSIDLLKTNTPITPLAEAKRFITDCMVSVGAPKEHAEALATLLTEADYRGHYSHGMNRLDMYISDVKSKLCDCKAVPAVVKETPATAWVDGKNGLGAVVGNFCMDLAIKKAKQVGIGWVVAKGSNHYGIAGMYPLQAIKQGLIGMSFTNTSPLMVPTRAKHPALGTNPLSLGAPGKQGDSFVLDMATTAVAVGKIEMAKRKGDPIPNGWALDTNGNSTTNAEVAYNSKRLMPLGGEEHNAGYKGSGLGFLVEIFSGILGGASYGPNIRSWGDTSRAANLGQCFVAINPECFAPGFDGRLTDLMTYMRKMDPANPQKPVMVAGDTERMHMKAVDKAGGVRYVQNQHDTCMKLANTLKVAPLKSK